MDGVLKKIETKRSLLLNIRMWKLKFLGHKLGKRDWNIDIYRRDRSNVGQIGTTHNLSRGPV